MFRNAQRVRGPIASTTGGVARPVDSRATGMDRALAQNAVSGRATGGPPTGSGVANSQRMEVKVAHMQPRDDDALLTPSEVAAMFRVNPKTVTRWARAGKISAIRTLGGHRRFRESEIRRFLEQVEEGSEL